MSRAVVANWKMNLTSEEIRAFAAAFSARSTEAAALGIAPPFPYLPLVKALLGDRVMLFAQNGHEAPKGAFTGEVSMGQLRDVGCDGVILGHSERRSLFHEDDARILAKVRAARAAGLLPLLCIGETLEERDGGRTLEVLGRQLGILAEAGAGPLWVAYEPVWAIGTGRRAEAPQVAEAHAFIRAELARHLGAEGAAVPVLYGGSVTPEGFPELLGIPEVAGGLVGGASLKADSFQRLAEQARG